MSAGISLFSGYNQKENRHTNYCLLLLKLLYEENPKYLSEALSRMTNTETLGSYVGVRFFQQQKTGTSTPDGLIRQEPFTIFIETKNWDWFYDDQLKRHLKELDKQTAGFKVLIALGNFETSESERFRFIEQLCQDEYKGRILFARAGFDDFLRAISLDHLPKNLLDTIAEFRLYLDEHDLLPRWESLLDVVNCAKWPEEIIEGQVYMCPTTGGSYSHARSKYFGMYGEKAVRHLAHIEAVIDLESESVAKLKWKNVSDPEESLIKLARDRHKKWRDGEFPSRVFILGGLSPTNFVKDTPGPMWGSKQYFDISRFRAKTVEDLAGQLNGLTWSELQGSIEK